jgi:hypothetical protein
MGDLALPDPDCRARRERAFAKRSTLDGGAPLDEAQMRLGHTSTMPDAAQSVERRAADMAGRRARSVRRASLQPASSSSSSSSGVAARRRAADTTKYAATVVAAATVVHSRTRFDTLSSFSEEITRTATSSGRM